MGERNKRTQTRKKWQRKERQKGYDKLEERNHERSKFYGLKHVRRRKSNNWEGGKRNRKDRKTK